MGMSSADSGSGAVAGEPATAASVAGVFSRIDALMAAGQVSEALALAVKANDELRDGALEERLVRLRQAAFSRLDKTGAHPAWPLPVEDLFPDTRGLVEIEPAELDRETLASAIVHHGSLVVRGLLSPARAQELKHDMDRAFAAFDQWREGVALSRLTPWFAPFDGGSKEMNSDLAKLRAFARRGGAVLTADSPRMLYEVLSAFGETGLVGVIGEYFGERPVVSARKSLMRRVPPDLPAADWHQDGAFLDRGAGLRTVNAWLALSDCGADTPAPGMEIVAGRLREIMPTGTGDACFDWTVGQEVVQELTPGYPIVRPRFAPGDVLLFDEFNLHRTATGPGMSQSRYALETWFFAPSSYPPHHVPLVT